QVEHRLIVERHFDKLLGAERTNRLAPSLDPNRTDDHGAFERATFYQAVGHGGKTVQGNLFDLRRIPVAELRRDRSQELRKLLTIGDGFRIFVRQYGQHVGVMGRTAIVRLTYSERNWQNPRLGTRQQVERVAYFLPL